MLFGSKAVVISVSKKGDVGSNPEWDRDEEKVSNKTQFENNASWKCQSKKK